MSLYKLNEAKVNNIQYSEKGNNTELKIDYNIGNISKRINILLKDSENELKNGASEEEVSKKLIGIINNLMKEVNKASDLTYLNKLNVFFERKINKFDMQLKIIKAKSSPEDTVKNKITKTIIYFITKIKKLFLSVINKIVAKISQLQRNYKLKKFDKSMDKLGVKSGDNSIVYTSNNYSRNAKSEINRVYKNKVKSFNDKLENQEQLLRQHEEEQKSKRK